MIQTGSSKGGMKMEKELKVAKWIYIAVAAVHSTGMVLILGSVIFAWVPGVV